MKHFFLVWISLLLVACGADAAPAPESDSGQAYQVGSEIPVDDNVYIVTGRVVADVSSLTRQSQPAYGGYSSYDGYGSGSYFGPQFDGKGFVRLLIETITPKTDIAEAGQIVIIKTSDTKAAALLPGDQVTFHCRAQYEALAAVRDNETFRADKVETWELDYCRMPQPVITVPGGGR